MAEEKEVGKITHYFNKIGVGVIALSGELRVGDKIHVKGATTDFEQVVESMQVEHEKLETAEAGSSVGLKMGGPVRAGDVVYKVIE